MSKCCTGTIRRMTLQSDTGERKYDLSEHWVTFGHISPLLLRRVEHSDPVFFVTSKTKHKPLWTETFGLDCTFRMTGLRRYDPPSGLTYFSGVPPRLQLSELTPGSTNGRRWWSNSLLRRSTKGHKLKRIDSVTCNTTSLFGETKRDRLKTWVPWVPYYFINKTRETKTLLNNTSFTLWST